MTRFWRKTKNNPEGVIQKEILDFLKDLETLLKKPIYYFRSWAGAVRTEGGGFFTSWRPGCPDISLIVNGKFIWIEVKAPGKKQSKSQIQAEDDIKKAGWEYFVVTSLLEVKTILAKEIDIF